MGRYKRHHNTKQDRVNRLVRRIQKSPILNQIGMILRAFQPSPDTQDSLRAIGIKFDALRDLANETHFTGFSIGVTVKRTNEGN